MKISLSNTVVAGLLCALLCIGLSSQAQETLSTTDSRAARSYRKAVELYGQRQFQQARTALEDAVQKDERFTEAWMLLGDLSLDMKDKDGALQAYEKGISLNPDFYPRAILVAADLHRTAARYDRAADYYEMFLLRNQLKPADRNAAELGLKSSLFAIHAMANPVPFEPFNLGSLVNSQYDEYVNAITTDNNLLLFTRKHPSEQRFPDGRPLLVEDFFRAEVDGDLFLQARPLGPPINTEGNEGALTISADKRYLFFSACNRRDGLGSCDIYYAVREDNGWSRPRNPRTPLNSARWDSHPSLSADNRTLVFASSREGGKGKSDLWVAVVGEDGKWGTPVNMGDSLNTPGQEMSPLIHPDGQTLYFASDGHPGMGGMDLFMTRKGPDGKWSQPVNLGYPINTVSDELALVVDAKGEWAYFSSDKLGGEGGYDMYRFRLNEAFRPVPVSYMKGFVFDALTRLPLRAVFEVVDLSNSNQVVSAGSDPATGEFLVTIPSGRSYALHVTAPGYLFYSDHFQLDEAKEIAHPYLKDVALQPIQVGQEVVMRNVFFETASYALLPESRAELDRLVKLLRENPGIQIEIGGHTDNVGSLAYNQKLSEDRAQSVLQYLVDHGIPVARLKAVGYGLSRPIATNDTDEGRALNRRTAFVVTKPE